VPSGSSVSWPLTGFVRNVIARCNRQRIGRSADVPGRMISNGPGGLYCWGGFTFSGLLSVDA
jgi:hypothetical protein